MKTIAIPIEEDKGLESRVSSNFGSGKYYLVLDLKGERVVSHRSVTAPDVDCGAWNCRATEFLATLQCDVVIVPRLGDRARSIFQESNIEIVRGEGAIAGAVLDAYLEGGRGPRP